jgi:hypothetical protein
MMTSKTYTHLFRSCTGKPRELLEDQYSEAEALAVLTGRTEAETEALRRGYIATRVCYYSHSKLKRTTTIDLFAGGTGWKTIITSWHKPLLSAAIH